MKEAQICIRVRVLREAERTLWAAKDKAFFYFRATMVQLALKQFTLKDRTFTRHFTERARPVP